MREDGTLFAMSKSVEAILNRSKFCDSASELAHILQCRLAELAMADDVDPKRLDATRMAYESISNRAVLMEKLKGQSASNSTESDDE